MRDDICYRGGGNEKEAYLEFVKHFTKPESGAQQPEVFTTTLNGEGFVSPRAEGGRVSSTPFTPFTRVIPDSTVTAMAAARNIGATTQTRPPSRDGAETYMNQLATYFTGRPIEFATLNTVHNVSLPDTASLIPVLPNFWNEHTFDVSPCNFTDVNEGVWIMVPTSESYTLYCCKEDTGSAFGTHVSLARYHYDQCEINASPVYPVSCAGEYKYNSTNNTLQFNINSGHYKPSWNSFVSIYNASLKPGSGETLREKPDPLLPSNEASLLGKRSRGTTSTSSGISGGGAGTGESEYARTFGASDDESDMGEIDLGGDPSLLDRPGATAPPPPQTSPPDPAAEFRDVDVGKANAMLFSHA
jgi:hypothetical protein